MYTTAAVTAIRGRAARVGVAVLLAIATVGLLGVTASDAAGSRGHLDVKRERWGTMPGGGARGPVTVDDAVVLIARFAGGAVASFEATRFATGHKEGLHVEINGDRGSIVWDLDRLNELEFFDATDDRGSQGFRRIRATEREHPYAAAWWPDGHTIGYEHTFTHEVRDLLVAIAAGSDPVPSFADGLQVQQVLDAVQRSAAAGSTWTEVAA